MLPKHILAGLKGCYQRGYYCGERLYSQISLKVWDSKEKLAFLSRLPLRRHIAWLGRFSVDPGILVSLHASAHHPYTTLATGEWTIFWPSEYSPVEVGPTECSRHLEIESSLHVRLLPATSQWTCSSAITCFIVALVYLNNTSMYKTCLQEHVPSCTAEQCSSLCSALLPGYFYSKHSCGPSSCHCSTLDYHHTNSLTIYLAVCGLNQMSIQISYEIVHV